MDNYRLIENVDKAFKEIFENAVNNNRFENKRKNYDFAPLAFIILRSEIIISLIKNWKYYKVGDKKNEESLNEYVLNMFTYFYETDDWETSDFYATLVSVIFAVFSFIFCFIVYTETSSMYFTLGAIIFFIVISILIYNFLRNAKRNKMLSIALMFFFKHKIKSNKLFYANINRFLAKEKDNPFVDYLKNDPNSYADLVNKFDVSKDDLEEFLGSFEK